MAARCLTYPGDVGADVLGQVMGPTRFDEYVVAIGAHYDAEHDRTRVQFRYVPPAQLADVVRDPFGLLCLPGEVEVITHDLAAELAAAVDAS